MRFPSHTLFLPDSGVKSYKSKCCQALSTNKKLKRVVFSLSFILRWLLLIKSSFSQVNFHEFQFYQTDLVLQLVCQIYQILPYAVFITFIFTLNFISLWILNKLIVCIYCSKKVTLVRETNMMTGGNQNTLLPILLIYWKFKKIISCLPCA